MEDPAFWSYRGSPCEALSPHLDSIEVSHGHDPPTAPNSLTLWISILLSEEIAYAERKKCVTAAVYRQRDVDYQMRQA